MWGVLAGVYCRDNFVCTEIVPRLAGGLGPNAGEGVGR